MSKLRELKKQQASLKEMTYLAGVEATMYERGKDLDNRQYWLLLQQIKGMNDYLGTLKLRIMDLEEKQGVL